MISKGYFVIVDITGYTAFLTHSELEEAQNIISFLLDGLLEAMRPPLVISNFQGDAILAYVPQGSFTQGQTFLEILENIYVTFLTLLDQMHRNACCDCDACENMPRLDLKLFVHYGGYLLHTLGGRQELSGPDVILVHRMMKNDVRERTGLQSYALLTEAAVEAMQLGSLANEMWPYTASYEHLGKVRMYAHDLRAVYERQHDAQRICVKPEEARLRFEIELPVPPPLAWDYLTQVENNRIWLQVDSIHRSDQNGGRVHSGAEFTCARSSGNQRFTIIDWRPFDYFTVDGVGFAGVHYHATYQLASTEKGSLFRWYWDYALEQDSAYIDTLYQDACQRSIMQLHNFIESDLAQGRITLQPAV